VLNERDDLSIFADGAFDFVFSFLVLQHMPPPLAESYLREFRVLKPGGIGYFQMPKYSRNPVKRILMKHAPIEALFWLLRHRSRQPFQMYGRDLDEIVAVIDRAGADGVRRPNRVLWKRVLARPQDSSAETVVAFRAKVHAVNGVASIIPRPMVVPQR
jgi:SAM-dependent methyltransferase